MNQLKSIYDDAVEAEKEGRIEEAIQLFEVAGGSGYPMAYIKLGDMQRQKGSETDAIEYYKLASEMDPLLAKEELKIRNITVKRPLNPVFPDKPSEYDGFQETENSNLHSSLSGLMVFLIFLLTADGIIQFILFMVSVSAKQINLIYLLNIIPIIIAIMICHQIDYLAEDVDKVRDLIKPIPYAEERTISLENKIRMLEQRISDLEQKK